MGTDWQGRDLADEATGELRDAAPDLLLPIDPDAPVSGHAPPAEASRPASETPEHDWSAARSVIFPLLRPAGTLGTALDAPLDATTPRPGGHTQPMVGEGPCDIVVAYALAANGFDVLVNLEHLLSWGIGGAELDETARANLSAWSSQAGWEDETSGTRRLLTSDSGTGRDAARILLPEVRDYLLRELAGPHVAPGTRVLIGLPERHLLLAGALAPGDDEFAALFQEFLTEHSEAAEEPIDRRVFELTGDSLQPFAG